MDALRLVPEWKPTASTVVLSASVRRLAVDARRLRMLVSYWAPNGSVMPRDGVNAAFEVLRAHEARGCESHIDAGRLQRRRLVAMRIAPRVDAAEGRLRQDAVAHTGHGELFADGAVVLARPDVEEADVVPSHLAVTCQQEQRGSQIHQCVVSTAKPACSQAASPPASSRTS